MYHSLDIIVLHESMFYKSYYYELYSISHATISPCSMSHTLWVHVLWVILYELYSISHTTISPYSISHTTMSHTTMSHILLVIFYKFCSISQYDINICTKFVLQNALLLAYMINNKKRSSFSWTKEEILIKNIHETRVLHRRPCSLRTTLKSTLLAREDFRELDTQFSVEPIIAAAC